MRSLYLRIIAFAAAVMLIFSAQALTKEGIRSEYKRIANIPSDASPYAETPDPEGYSTAGRITPEAEESALALVNFMRSIAGLENVETDPLYSLRAQNAALVLAGNDALSHAPVQPDGMGDDIYQSGYIGASMSNIAKFNWMHSGILLDGVKYFARDDGEFNLSVLGHRRWLLDPQMKKTGFGLANAQSGNSFVVMHAVDGSNAGAAWDYVPWPAAGAFPTEFMQPDIAWSVTLNESVYDTGASDPEIILSEEKSGMRFSFQPASGEGDGYCCISWEDCGSGPCLIFRPNFSMTDFTAYEQNQIWNVCIRNLTDTSGNSCEIAYRCEMISLYPQDVANVEISQLNAEMTTGETIALSANVIPSYADDLRVFWSSSDASVAAVDESGNVSALASGKCTITVSSINGRTDCCEITVN